MNNMKQKYKKNKTNNAKNKQRVFFGEGKDIDIKELLKRKGLTVKQVDREKLREIFQDSNEIYHYLGGHLNDYEKFPAKRKKHYGEPGKSISNQATNDSEPDESSETGLGFRRNERK